MNRNIEMEKIKPLKDGKSIMVIDGMNPLIYEPETPEEVIKLAKENFCFPDDLSIYAQDNNTSSYERENYLKLDLVFKTLEKVPGLIYRNRLSEYCDEYAKSLRFSNFIFSCRMLDYGPTLGTKRLFTVSYSDHNSYFSSIAVQNVKPATFKTMVERSVPYFADFIEPTLKNIDIAPYIFYLCEYILSFKDIIDSTQQRIEKNDIIRRVREYNKRNIELFENLESMKCNFNGDN